MSFEDEVRTMLARRAADVSVGEAAWRRLVERLESDEVVTVPVPAGRRRGGSGPWRLAAAVLVVVGVAASALVLVARDDERGGDQVRVVAPPSTTVPAPAGEQPRAGELRALYPAGSSAELQALADDPRRHDLRDPRAVAGAYVRQRLGPDVDYVVEAFQQGDTSSGEVPYRTVPGGGSGRVLVRRFASIWVVTGVEADAVAVRMAGYDGVSTEGSAEALTAGRLVVSVDAGVAGTGDAMDEIAVRRGQRVPLTMEFPGYDAVVLRVRFVSGAGAVSFGDYLLGVPGTTPGT